MKAAIISTLRHNVGDDFVREGIVGLLQETLARERPGSALELDVIHKHSPVTTVYGLERIRSLRLSRLIEPVARALRLPDRIGRADLLVQSGAPIYWCHENGSRCERNEWFDPLVRGRFLSDRRGRRFFNLAGGSCQRYHSDASEMGQFPDTLAYMAEFFDACDLTTLRDVHAQRMLKAAGRDAEVLPCTSIYARDQLRIEPETGDYIVLNFMENGGHFTFGQTIDKERWRDNFRRIHALTSRMGRVVAACHSPAERDLVREVVPDIEAFIVPDDHVEFMRFYAHARFGIVNRVHAGFMLASFGKPVAVIGTDTRALMIANLGLPSYFVEDVTDAEAIVEQTAAREAGYREEIEHIRTLTRARYIELLAEAL
ncbi:polysaccharide pyruvyl transferase family protein [Roseinatronobacter sp.]|uniref:polysaccharide pyruvyl transferase family protein n=1 Tax=Roseinatronobacter sp. TaxID=1945755 RepID=UPI0025ECBC1F|nr:polysaccharide pyruvyl transferase family protein [Roseibaca sp.]